MHFIRSNQQPWTHFPRKKIHLSPQQAYSDLDYADNIALLSDQINNAEVLLHSLETAAHKVGLTLDSTKTECMLLNEESTGNEIHNFSWKSLNTVDEFKYLGSNITDSKNDFNIRRALAWSACNKLHLIWKSDISKDTKLAFFQASVESILLGDAETWKTFRWWVYKATYESIKLILERSSHSG